MTVSLAPREPPAHFRRLPWSHDVTHFNYSTNREPFRGLKAKLTLPGGAIYSIFRGMNQDFLDYYRSLSTVELLQIQAEKEKYQPEAIEALNTVLQSRTITIEDQQEADKILDAQQQKQERIKEKKESAKALAEKAVETVIPMGKKTVQQQLVLFCIGLLLIFIWVAPGKIKYLVHTLPDGGFFDFYTWLVISDLCVFPVMIVLLFKRKKAGWTITSFIFTISFISSITDLFLSFEYNDPIFARLHPTMPVMLASVLITGGVLYYINTAKFITLFVINRKGQFITLGLGLFTALALIFIF